MENKRIFRNIVGELNDQPYYLGNFYDLWEITLKQKTAPHPWETASYNINLYIYLIYFYSQSESHKYHPQYQ